MAFRGETPLMRRASPPDSSEQPLPRKALAHRREPRARPRARGRLEVRLDCRFPRISGHGPGREICRVWRGQELKWADLRAPRVSSWRTLPAHQNVTDWASDLGFPLVGASSAPVLELALRRRNKASFPKPCVAGSIPAGGTCQASRSRARSLSWRVDRGSGPAIGPVMILRAIRPDPYRAPMLPHY